MNIYIASSFRNLHAVQLLTAMLEDSGHTVFDWTRLAPPLAGSLTPEQRRAALDADEYGDIFAFCTQACASVDLVIYLGAAGQDSACEVGIAYAAGVPVYGLAGPLETPGTILSRAVSRWCDGATGLLAAVAAYAAE